MWFLLLSLKRLDFEREEASTGESAKLSRALYASMLRRNVEKGVACIAACTCAGRQNVLTGACRFHPSSIFLASLDVAEATYRLPAVGSP